jgi:hypothetical protein
MQQLSRASLTFRLANEAETPDISFGWKTNAYRICRNGAGAVINPSLIARYATTYRLALPARNFGGRFFSESGASIPKQCAVARNYSSSGR